MTYVVNSGRIKTGTWKTEGGESFIERGEPVPDDLFSPEELAKLLADNVLIDQDQFVEDTRVAPENQPTGTPSNLEQIEGTALQMNPPEPPEDKDAPKQENPADVANVDGAPTPGDGSDSAGQNVEGTQLGVDNVPEEKQEPVDPEYDADGFPLDTDKDKPANWNDFTDEEKHAYIYGDKQQ
jgi:hypothetical protein